MYGQKNTSVKIKCEEIKFEKFTFLKVSTKSGNGAPVVQ